MIYARRKSPTSGSTTQTRVRAVSSRRMTTPPTFKKKLGNRTFTGFSQCRLCGLLLDSQLEHGETCSTAEAIRGHHACVHAVLRTTRFASTTTCSATVDVTGKEEFSFYPISQSPTCSQPKPVNFSLQIIDLAQVWSNETSGIIEHDDLLALAAARQHPHQAAFHAAAKVPSKLT